MGSPQFPKLSCIRNGEQEAGKITSKRVAKSFASQKLFGFLSNPKRKAADFENGKVGATYMLRPDAGALTGQRRFYDTNLWTKEKKLERLNDMRRNPVKRGLVREPGEWKWSSWKFCHLNDTSLLAMDRNP